MTQPYFTNIQYQIIQTLKQAKTSVHVAVAWFTAPRLFNELCQLSQKGVEVKLLLMDDQITRNCAIDYSQLDSSGGKVYMIDESGGILMHNKFCVIDERIVITGSYNWSKKAESNHENITITTDEPDLAQSFVREFKRIIELHYGKEPKKAFDLNIISKRLSVIAGLIALGDYNDIKTNTEKLLQYDLPSPIETIVNKLDKNDWVAAESDIAGFLKNAVSLRIYSDYQIEELRWKIKYLETEIIALEGEQEIIRKSITDFLRSYTLRFGALLEKILKLKKEKLLKQNNAKSKIYEQAEKDYVEFKQKFERESKIEDKLFKLNDQETDDIKKLYRAAAKLCHPDKIKNAYPSQPEVWAQAEELFKTLSSAYEKNDLQQVRSIYEKLRQGLFDKPDIKGMTNLESLQLRYQELQQKYQALLKTLKGLTSSADYQLMSKIYDLDEFYRTEQEKLENELNALENDK